MLTKALVFSGPGEVSCREADIGEPGGDSALVRVEACGICATDLHILRGEFLARPPVILGHEFSGVVERGPDSILGQRVSVEPHHYCGVCKPCRSGRENLCTDRRAYGLNQNGGMARWAVVDPRNCYPVPPSVPARIAALAENVACCIHGVDRAGVRLGDDVAVVGAGAVGLILLQLARRAGAARILVVEPDPARAALALELGASAAVAPGDAPRALAELTAGELADVVIDATGVASAQRLALELAGRGATVEFFGVASPAERIAVSAYDVYARELAIVGAALNPGTHLRAVQALSWLELDAIAGDGVSLEAARAHLTGQRPVPAIKVVVDPWREDAAGA